MDACGYNATTPDFQAIDIFNHFTETKSLGAARLQSICDNWLTTSIAKEFAIESIKVVEVESKIEFIFATNFTHTVEDREEYFFPMDELLLYIADHAVGSDDQKAAFKKAIVAKRRAGGPDVYRRFMVNLGPKLPLFLVCKNPQCAFPMMTQFCAHKCETFKWGPVEVECVRCHARHHYDQGDLQFRPDLCGG
jgi:hypothetical protein